MGSPATSPPFCPRWLLVGRHMHPHPPMADLVQPLLWPGNLVPATQTRATCCWTSWQIGLFEAGVTCCILFGRPPEGETTLSGWYGLAWIACLLPYSAGLECVGLWELLDFWYTRSRFFIVEHKVGPTSCRLSCLCMTPLWCCLSLQVLSCVCRGLRTLFRLEGLPWVLCNWYATCFPNGTRCLLQCVSLSERPTLLLICL